MFSLKSEMQVIGLFRYECQLTTRVTVVFVQFYDQQKIVLRDTME